MPKTMPTLFECSSDNFDGKFKQSLALAVSEQPNPSIIKLNRDFLEEFGYLPDCTIIEFFVECIKKKKNDRADITEKTDPKLEFAARLAGQPKPSVQAFLAAYRTEYGELPPTSILKYFIFKVKSSREVTSRKKQADFILAEEIANSEDPSYSKLRDEFKSTRGKEPSFEVIDFFITKILKRGEG